MKVVEIDIHFHHDKDREKFVVQGHDDIYWCDTIEEALIVIKQELEWWDSQR